MEAQKTFLFVTWDGGGNVPPVLGLAGRLVKRGHQVHVLAEPCLKEAVSVIGAEFRAFNKHFTRSDGSVDIIKDSNAKPLTIPAVDNILVRPAFDVAKETLAVLEQIKTDVLVADFMMPGSLIAAEVIGVKRVALFHMPEYLPGPGRPPGGMGLLPSKSPLGVMRDKLLTKVFHRVINQYLPALNKVRESFLLPLYTSFPDIYHQADLRLIQTSQVFDAPIIPPPENVRYVGPVLDDPVWSKSDSEYTLWPKSDIRPLVVVSLSSTFQNQLSVLKKIMKAVTGMPIRCLVTLGPAMSKECLVTPENVILLAAVPHNHIFPRANAVVTHAGHGTIMRALSHGLPLVCIPMGRDQIDNAALVAHHGAGLKLGSNANFSRIRKAIMRVLDEPSFTKGAQALQMKILADAKADRGVEALEELAAL